MKTELPGNSALKQLGLITVLCKTYKKDTIFAGGLNKLLETLENEIKEDAAKLNKV